jgi:hypothetical protein
MIGQHFLKTLCSILVALSLGYKTMSFTLVGGSKWRRAAPIFSTNWEIGET